MAIKKITLPIWVVIEFNTINGQFISRKWTWWCIAPLVRKWSTRSRTHRACNAINVTAIPWQFLRLRHISCDIRDADPCEWGSLNAQQIPGHCDIFSYNIAVTNPMDQWHCIWIILVIWVLPIVSSHPEHPLHCVQIHAPNKDVLHKATTSWGSLDPDTGLRVDCGDVFSSHVLDATRHLTPKSNDGTGGGDAGEPSDDDVLARHAKGDAIFIPSTFYSHTIIARDNVAVLYSNMGTGICKHIKPNV